MMAGDVDGRRAGALELDVLDNSIDGWLSYYLTLFNELLLN